MPISCIPITEVCGEKSFALWEYEQALEIERLDADRKSQRVDAGGIDLEDVIQAVGASSSEFYQALQSDIESSIKHYNDMVQAMDTASGIPQHLPILLNAYRLVWMLLTILQKIN